MNHNESVYRNTCKTIKNNRFMIVILYIENSKIFDFDLIDYYTQLEQYSKKHQIINYLID